ncbi:phage integrase N-terminal SAM-like domain-containing protein [Pseudoalteromonas sp. L23]|uniref:phage integrase N-terminal SAM-like domain-containing protein n=1 Tax=unclassified Pseudoalteromonas TaxID=194690 RepID=UPI001EF0014D|nr:MULTISPECIES: phage integrase N-terminal SAM-like domain-containing protein [unclassified Pseudoalteromonas]MCF7515931.1 phage integrase N-terminal SAM-like domain-containing protein [Pseudoalteromonas sp. L7]MCF7527973.1 phage integrase N-terminal SAM-like domain-containing protein [Pseudoalteromonas sp. L23]MCX2766216.1 phage integrase N-terminal SAM-like domain-containing protein [Pseudoalteromonas sp. B530]
MLFYFTSSTLMLIVMGVAYFPNDKRHPASMGDNEVVEYLDYLVLKRNVSPKTQATALNALSFLYKQIIKQDLCPNLVNR